MSAKQIGVYICQCGGNIGDYVDVNEVVAAVEKEQGVSVAKTAMFTCSDATQSEIIADAQEQGLDGLVIASCSPKLHTYTFRDVAKRAGMNPFQYTQVNVREQCSWTHTDDHAGATEKAVRLVRAGINRTRLTDPLEPIVVETTPASLVVGGGIAGLRAALGLAEIGLSVFLVEKEPQLGGWVAGFGEMYPHGRNGAELIAKLEEKVRSHPAITVFTQAELIAKGGSFGNYEVTVAIQSERLETIQMVVGSIVIATGFDTYQPAEGELGYGMDGVVTIAEFKKLLDQSAGPLEHNGRPVNTVAYIYCVGSRQGEDVEGGNTYCSRYCCTAAVHAATQVADLPARVHQYHFYRDMRTYGKFELLYAEALEKGSAFVKFPDDEPPAVAKDANRRRDGDVTRPAVRRRGGRAHRRPRRAGHRHGAARERRPHQGAQAPGRPERLLQRDPPQAAAGRDGRRRRLHLRRLPGAADLVRVRRLRAGGGDAERRHPQARLRRARPAGGHRGR